MPSEASPEASSPWHYERAGARVGPVDEAEIRRLLHAGDITRDTLVWNAKLGPKFVRLSETSLAGVMTEPPPLPASAVDDTLAWVLAALPLGWAVLEYALGSSQSSGWGWPLAAFAATVVIAAADARRVRRSGVVDRAIHIGRWVWLVPVYLFKRAQALKGPKHYVWAWLASFVASLFIGSNNLAAVVTGETYAGSGVPSCDSNYEARQVSKIFDTLPRVRSAGTKAVSISNARELGLAGGLRTCAASILASNGATYATVFTVERRAEGILTNVTLR